MSNTSKTSCFKCGHRHRSKEKGGDDDDVEEEVQGRTRGLDSTTGARRSEQ